MRPTLIKEEAGKYPLLAFACLADRCCCGPSGHDIPGPVNAYRPPYTGELLPEELPEGTDLTATLDSIKTHCSCLLRPIVYVPGCYGGLRD